MLYGKTNLAVCLTATAFASLLTASAQVVYENGFEGYQNQNTPGANGVPLGDSIGLTSGGILTDAAFGYFLSPTRSGNETAVLSIYALDGGTTPQGVTLPGTLLFTSSAFNISSGTTAEGFGSLNVGSIATLVPNSIAYTITFSGLEAGETAGLLFANDPTMIGTNPTFLDSGTGTQEHFTIRREANGTWTVIDFPGVVDNLNASFTVVPEPNTFALMIGGLAAMGLIRRRK